MIMIGSLFVIWYLAVAGVTSAHAFAVHFAVAKLQLQLQRVSSDVMLM